MTGIAWLAMQCVGLGLRMFDLAWDSKHKLDGKLRSWAMIQFQNQRALCVLEATQLGCVCKFLSNHTH